MDEYDFYKDHYLFEIERKNALQKSLSIPIGIIVLLCGAVLIVAKSVSSPIDWLTFLKIAFLITSVFCILWSIYFLCRFHYGFAYGFLASPKETYEYKKQLEEYYEKEGLEPDNADLEFKKYIISQYVEYTDINIKNNDDKSYYLYKANLSIVFSVFLLSFQVLFLLIKR